MEYNPHRMREGFYLILYRVELNAVSKEITSMTESQNYHNAIKIQENMR